MGSKKARFQGLDDDDRFHFLAKSNSSLNNLTSSSPSTFPPATLPSLFESRVLLDPEAKAFLPRRLACH